MRKKEEKVYFSDYYNDHKVLVWVFVLVLLFIVVLTVINYQKGNSGSSDRDTVITIKPDSDVTVGVGNSVSLYADMNDVYHAVTWTSSNPNIAFVNNGTVTGVNYGKVNITASFTDNDGNLHQSTKEVTVADGDSSVSLIDARFPEGDLYMALNDTYKLSLVLTPYNALVNERTFTSTNPNIVKVDDLGNVKSLNTGSARIIATINGNITRSINIYVGDYSSSEIVISPSSLSFDSDIRKIKVGDSEVLNYSISPVNSDRSKLTFSSSDTSVVTVTQNGKITALKEGTAVISLSSMNGKRDGITIEVYNSIIPVTDIILPSSDIKMEAGKTEIITPKVMPDNASNKGLSYVSLDSNIVSIVPSQSGEYAVVSALKEGKTSIIIGSGNITKKINVTVTGSGNNSEADDGDPKLPTTIQIRSNKNNLAKSYEEAKKIPVSGVTTVSIKLAIGVGRIKYCINRYESVSCTPNIELAVDGTVDIPSGGMYVLRVKKYDYEGNEISSTSPNYVNGVLNYYINTTSTDPVLKKYTITNAYSSETTAKAIPAKINDKITIRVNDSSRSLKVCFTTNSYCTPNLSVKDVYSFSINQEGTWRVMVNEYDENNKLLGNTETYYSYVKSSNASGNTNTDTGKTNNTGNNASNDTKVNNDKLTVSNLNIQSQVLIGKYLAADVESTAKFQEVRFCYKVVSKGSTTLCNLDLTSTSVASHNGNSYFHPLAENNTYYASFTETSKKTFWFDIDGLDNLFDNSDTNKDVVFVFAVGSKSNNKTVYSSPIKVRIHMNSRNGNDSNWTSTFIK